MARTSSTLYNYFNHCSKSKQMQVTSNNYVWLDVTNRAIMLFNSGALPLYGVQADYQYLIDSMEDLISEIESGNKICLEVGRFI